MLVKVGEKLDLNLQLGEGEIDLFPRVHIYDDAASEIAGSPVDLTHIAKGLYSDSGLVVPSGSTHFKAQHIVFSDSGHLIETDYDRKVEVFQIYVVTVDIPGIGTNILGFVQEVPKLVGFVRDGQTLIGFVGDEKIVGQVEDFEHIIHQNNDFSEITGTVGCSV